MPLDEKEIKEPEWNYGNAIDGSIFIARAIIYLAKMLCREISKLRKEVL